MAWFARGLILTLSLVAFAGCKQGEGERCEIDSDCSDGLICSESKKECTSGGDLTDAGFLDAFFADARFNDADQPQPDSTPVGPDANTVDADTTDADTTDADPADAM